MAELLGNCGLQAFTRCRGFEEFVESAMFGEQRLQVSLLRFTGGVLKLTRGLGCGKADARQFVSVDFLDYRAAVLDPAIVADAYRRFAATVRAYLDGLADPAQIEVRCCPHQGTAFISVESQAQAPSEAGISRFLIRYFGEERVQADLHHAFGEATLAFARATVPSIVAAITM